MSRQARLRVLYVVYWGAAEPLGQSLVLPAVKRLARLGADLTLVTFEKSADFANKDEMGRIAASLHEHGVRWTPLKYHKRPKAPATSFDIIRGVAHGVASRLRERPDVVHARTFIGGLMGLALAPLLRTRLVYHNEGFYPDEQVDGGVWTAHSTAHRVATSLERRLYGRADGIITMSHRAKRLIEQMSAVRRKETPVIVVPSCVDLNHFKPSELKPPAGLKTLRCVYVGSVGGRYRLDKAAKFVSIAQRELGLTHLRVLTRQEPGLVASMLGAGGLSDDSWSTDSVHYSAMPRELEEQDAGLFFLEQGLSEHGCSPTKIGEYWAMGLPVVTTPNVSDTDDIIRRERVGVIVRENSDDAYRQAALELRSLLEDPGLATRCRRAAETYYALDPACERQSHLYRELVSARRAAQLPSIISLRPAYSKLGKDDEEPADRAGVE
ncbi:MAG: glycosyltransferase [Acidobacteriota bacterium]